ncbi:MAG: hypothetical protein ABI758_00335 [Candidatus Woesebacteria bacterium]
MKEGYKPGESGDVPEVIVVTQFQREVSVALTPAIVDRVEGYFDSRRDADTAKGQRLSYMFKRDNTGVKITFESFSEVEGNTIQTEVEQLVA